MSAALTALAAALLVGALYAIVWSRWQARDRRRRRERLAEVRRWHEAEARRDLLRAVDRDEVA